MSGRPITKRQKQTVAFLFLLLSSILVTAQAEKPVPNFNRRQQSTGAIDANEEKLQIRLDYLFFDDVDMASMQEPSLEAYQALSCQTDLFLRTILEERVQSVVRISLEIIRWTLDVTLASRMSLVFYIKAVQDHNDQPIPQSDIINVVENADFHQYIMKYVWKSYPIGGTDTEILRQVNSINYATNIVRSDPRIPIMYETSVCPALNYLTSTWSIAFFNDAFTRNPTPEDFHALGCQMYTFVAEVILGQYFGAPAEVTMQNLTWTFYSPDAEGFALNVTGDIQALVYHSDGSDSPIPSPLVNDLMIAADYVGFIETKVQKIPPPAGEIWANVRKVRVEGTQQDVVVGADEGWTSGESCPRVTQSPTVTPILTPAPTTVPPTVTMTTATPPPTATIPPAVPALEGGGTVPAKTADGGDFMELCREALFAADKDGNKHLSESEYVHLINLLDGGAYEGYPFVALPMTIKSNFETWDSEDADSQIELEAMIVEGTGDESPLDDQQAHRDAICQGTQSAVQTASGMSLPSPVRLNVTNAFLVSNQKGMKTRQEFLDTSQALVPAYVEYLETYVAVRLPTLLLGSRRLRSRSLSAVQYWILQNTTAVTGVQEADCPEGSPKSESCLLASAQYEIFALTTTPEDLSDMDRIVDAAHKVTAEGIVNGQLQTILGKSSPDSPWSVRSAPVTPATTTLPTSVPEASKPPATAAGADPEVLVDGDGLEGEVAPANATLHMSESQCGGDVGKQALNMTGFECDSFVGAHIWHIAVIAGLGAFLVLAFCPLLIWGRYPCCGSKQPISRAHFVRGRGKGAVDHGSGGVTQSVRSVDGTASVQSGGTVQRGLPHGVSHRGQLA